MLLGYIRVSTIEQNEERQTRALLERGVEKENLYIDKQSGKNADREQLKALLAFCRKGDVVITESISTDQNSVVRRITECPVNIKEITC